MKTTNELTPELKKAEEEIDNYYKSNPLVKLPFATAAWSFLSFVEDYMHYMTRKTVQIEGTQGLLSLGSKFSREFLVEIRHSLWWLFDACESEGQVPYKFDENLYKASRDMFELGKKYESFVFAYTCSNHNWIELEVQGFTIQSTEGFLTGMEYAAYNILIDWHETEDVLPLLDFEICPIDAIQHVLRIKGNRFRYKLNPRMVSDMITYLKPQFDRMFLLPSEWKFNRYILGDFRKVFETICAIANIHWCARMMAVDQGCDLMGYLDSIYVLDCNELESRVIRYSGLQSEKV